MSFCKSLTLLGTQESRILAKGMLENHPGIRRIDSQSGYLQLKLIGSGMLSDMEILHLIKDSGLSGVVLR